MNVTIQNPAPDGATHVSIERAQQLKARGLAEFISAYSIRILMRSKHRYEDGYCEAVATGQLNQRQARGLPFAGDVGRLGLSA